MNFTGILIGTITFIIIGLFHPLVIKTEYYLGARTWILFCLAGIVSITASLFVEDTTISVSLGILGFSSLWSIKEVIDQEKRVKEGRFPRNPKRKYE